MCRTSLTRAGGGDTHTYTISVHVAQEFCFLEYSDIRSSANTITYDVNTEGDRGKSHGGEPLPQMVVVF